VAASAVVARPLLVAMPMTIDQRLQVVAEVVVVEVPIKMVIKLEMMVPPVDVVKAVVDSAEPKLPDRQLTQLRVMLRRQSSKEVAIDVITTTTTRSVNVAHDSKIKPRIRTLGSTSTTIWIDPNMKRLRLPNQL